MEDWLEIKWSIDEHNITLQEWQQIYEFGGWESQGSGPGSKLEFNSDLIAYLNNFISQNSVSSLIDLGCGDLQWMPQVFSSGIDYVGVDFCQSVINQNTTNYPDKTFIFSDFKNLSEAREVSFSKDVIHHDRDNMSEIFDKISQLASRYCMIVVPEYMKRQATFEILIDQHGYSCALDYNADEPKCLYLKVK